MQHCVVGLCKLYSIYHFGVEKRASKRGTLFSVWTDGGILKQSFSFQTSQEAKSFKMSHRLADLQEDSVNFLMIKGSQVGGGIYFKKNG